MLQRSLLYKVSFKHCWESLEVFLHLLGRQESVSTSFPLPFAPQIPSCYVTHRISGRFSSETVVPLCQRRHRCFLRSAQDLGSINQSVNSLSGMSARMAGRFYIPIPADKGTTFEKKMARFHLKTIAEPDWKIKLLKHITNICGLQSSKKKTELPFKKTFIMQLGDSVTD